MIFQFLINSSLSGGNERFFVDPREQKGASLERGFLLRKVSVGYQGIHSYGRPGCKAANPSHSLAVNVEADCTPSSVNMMSHCGLRVGVILSHRTALPHCQPRFV